VGYTWGQCVTYTGLCGEMENGFRDIGSALGQDISGIQEAVGSGFDQFAYDLWIEFYADLDLEYGGPISASPVLVPLGGTGSISDAMSYIGSYGAAGCTLITCFEPYSPPPPPPPPQDCYAGPHPTCQAGKPSNALLHDPVITKGVSLNTNINELFKEGDGITEKAKSGQGTVHGTTKSPNKNDTGDTGQDTGELRERISQQGPQTPEAQSPESSAGSDNGGRKPPVIIDTDQEEPPSPGPGPGLPRWAKILINGAVGAAGAVVGDCDNHDCSPIAVLRDAAIGFATSSIGGFGDSLPWAVGSGFVGGGADSAISQYVDNQGHQVNPWEALFNGGIGAGSAKGVDILNGFPELAPLGLGFQGDLGNDVRSNTINAGFGISTGQCNIYAMVFQQQRCG
jgi:hypothetical protein